MTISPLYTSFEVSRGVPIAPEFLRWLDLLRLEVNGSAGSAQMAATAYLAPLSASVSTSYEAQTETTAGTSYAACPAPMASTVYT